jgi:SAM-dependent methyltransferase
VTRLIGLHTGPLPDMSCGYDDLAEQFMSGRSSSSVGAGTVRVWARGLERGASVLDLGCGHGEPITRALIDSGLDVYGVDASPNMTAAFAARFPWADVACESVQESAFFERTFDAVVAWGLMFLLSPDDQELLIRKVGAVLRRGGKFLFTAPAPTCAWPDLLTGRRSISLGAHAYAIHLAEAGLTLLDTFRDEGRNHYYDASKI